MKPYVLENTELDPPADQLILLFKKPLRAKFYRCTNIPEAYNDDPALKKEIEQVLNSICKFKRKDIWFFEIDQDAIEDIGITFMHMDVTHAFLSPEVIPDSFNCN